MVETTTSSRRDGTENNLVNLLEFAVLSLLRSHVSTAIPVKVTKVTPSEDGAGFVSAIPLVTTRDPKGNSIAQVSIPRLPYFRLYAGRAAIVCDPVVGDIGLAVFAQQDSSLVNAKTETPEPAGSFRMFDISDGFYLGGFYKGKGDTRIVFDQEGNITVDAPEKITINTKVAEVNASISSTVNTKDSTVNASNSATVNTNTSTVNADSSATIKANSTLIDSPSTRMTGTLMVVGHITGTGGISVSGGSGGSSASIEGSMTVTKGSFDVKDGDVKAGSISLQGHVHGGVQGGSSKTKPAE